MLVNDVEIDDPLEVPEAELETAAVVLFEEGGTVAVLLGVKGALVRGGVMPLEVGIEEALIKEGDTTTVIVVLS